MLQLQQAWPRAVRVPGAEANADPWALRIVSTPVAHPLCLFVFGAGVFHGMLLVGVKIRVKRVLFGPGSAVSGCDVCWQVGVTLLFAPTPEAFDYETTTTASCVFLCRLTKLVLDHFRCVEWSRSFTLGVASVAKPHTPQLHLARERLRATT